MIIHFMMLILLSQLFFIVCVGITAIIKTIISFPGSAAEFYKMQFIFQQAFVGHVHYMGNFPVASCLRFEINGVLIVFAKRRSADRSGAIITHLIRVNKNF